MPGRAGAAIGVALVVVLGACGGNGGRSAALKVRAAADATTGAGSARIHTTVTGLEHDEEKAGASPESLDERALVDFRTGDASVTFGPTGREALFGPGTELRKVDGVVYMRFQTPELPVPMPNPSPVRRTGPEGPSPAASSQTWMKIDITDNGDPIEHPAMGILSGALGSVGLVPEPTTWLAAIDREGDVEDVGHDQLGDVATTRYRATIGMAALIGRVPGGSRPDRDARAAAAAGKHVDLDIWVDGAGRVRRLVAEIPARHGPVTIRTELSDFGIPLHVEAPPADQVFDPQALDDAAVPNTA